MSFRIVTGEKSKSCVVVAVGASLYLVESAFEASGASIIQGLGVFFATHAAVLLAKCAFVLRRAATDENMAKLLKFVVVATLLMGLFAVCCIYASGKAFDTDWRAYVNALVIGGLSAIFHVVPFEKFKRKSAAFGVPHER
jgi:amino acid transporter